jgi:ribosomal protein S21
MMMGVRIVVYEKESIGTAFRRFRKLMERHRASWKWHKQIAHLGQFYYVKPSKIRGVKEFMKKVKARQETRRAKHAGEQ